MKTHKLSTFGGARTIGAAILISLAGLAASAQTAGLPPPEDGALARLNSSPRHGEWASIEAGGTGPSDKLGAWVVYPERPDPAPVVLVIHEIFGLNDWARAVADQLAADGYIAIAPDLLSGKAPGGKGSSAVSPDAARPLIAALDPAEVTRRLDAAAAYGLALPAAGKKFAVVGFCWGGGTAFTYASNREDLGAAISFYGVAPPAPALAKIRAPVLALYGGNDARVTSTEAPTAAELKRLGKRFESEIYAGAGHAFLRQQGGMNGANLEATRQSWPRVLQFLKGTLSPAQTGAVGSAASLAETAAVYDDCCEMEMDGVAALPASSI